MGTAGLGPCLGAVVVATCVAAVAGAPATRADDLPRVALLVTEDNGPETSLVFARPGRPLPAPVARLRHLPDAAVRGALLPGGDEAAVVADLTPGRDRSWGSHLVLVTPGREPLSLCDRVAHAARPLVTGDRRVVVQRGEPGQAREGQYRVDRLTVDEVDPRTGAVRTLLRTDGFAAFPAALHAGEVIVYLVGPEGARLVAVDRSGDPGSRPPRVVVPSLPPFARDFSVAPDGRIVFACRDAVRKDLWTVESVALASGERRRLHASRGGTLAPFAWPDGEVTWNGDSGRGLAGTRRPLAAPGESALLEVGAITPDGALAAAYHVVPAAPAGVVLVDGAGRVVARVVAPSRTRLEIVGFLP